MNRSVNTQAAFIAVLIVVAALVGLLAATADANGIDESPSVSLVRTSIIAR